MLKQILHALVLLSLVTTSLCLAQAPARRQSDQAELKELLRRTLVTLADYRAKFKDLGAQEDQTVEEYDNQGKLTRQRRIVSDLVIYQSQLDPTKMAEYRNVREVDGKAVGKRDERLVNLFKRLTKAESFQKELERINREGQRYDHSYSMSGLTLNQGLLLYENMHQFFQFIDAGRERINGREVIVIQYQQFAQTPDLNTEFKKLPPDLKGAEPFYRGRLWLDAETAQIRREERELTLRIPSVKDPLVVYRFEFEYADSRFGILTPQRIVWKIFDNGRTTDKGPELLLSAKVTFDYSNFQRFDVAAPDASIEPPKKP
jgi:hypothetical protein